VGVPSRASRVSIVTTDDPLTILYGQLLDGWNTKDAAAMADALAPDGLVIGFDGSQMDGRDAAATELGRIFADHEPATYVTKIRSVRRLGEDAGVLHAVAGMIPPGESEIMPDRNAIQTVVGRRGPEGWRVALFQTTPARFDGRPDLTEALTAELTDLVSPSDGAERSLLS
jgi:uncharacterized protein (TIGR02246 family)